MFSKIFTKRRNDRADSAIVSFVIVLPLFFSFIITMVDTSIYFANRSIIQQLGRDAARTVSIFGGNGNATQETPLEASYGQSRCSTATSDAKAMSVNKTDIECGLATRLLGGTGVASVVFVSVACGPEKSPAVGSETFCIIKWTYDGIPGAVMNFVSKKGSSGSYFQNNTTRVTSESEVGLADIPLVPRN